MQRNDAPNTESHGRMTPWRLVSLLSPRDCHILDSERLSVSAPQQTTSTTEDHANLRQSLYQRLVASPTPEDTALALAEAKIVAHSTALPTVLRMAVVSYACFHHINNANFEAAAHILDEAPADIVSHARYALDIAYLRAVICNRKGALQEALDILDGVITAATTLDIPTTRARALTLVASLCESLGDLPRAEAVYAEAFQLKEDLGDRHGLGVAAFNFACFLDRQGLYDPSLEYYRRAADVERSYDDVASLALTLSHMAMVFARLQRIEAAREYAQEAKSLLVRSAPPLTAVATLINLATTYNKLGENDAQRTTLLAALEMVNQHSVDAHRVNIHLELADQAVREGNLDQAERLVMQAKDLLALHPDPLSAAHVLLRCAHLGVAREQWDYALPHASAAIGQFAKLGAIVELGEAVDLLATIVAATNAPQTAKVELRQALHEYRRLTDERETRRYAVLMSRVGAERERKDAEIEYLRTIELAAANKRLELLNADLTKLANEKDEFLAIAAHDLRNPLFEIRAAMTTIVQNVHELPPNDVRALCRDVQASVTRMMATVSTFLTMAQSSSKVSLLAHESVNLTFLARRAMERHSARGRERGVTLALDVRSDVWATGDPNLIDAILDNLISNAIKYTDPNSTVSLRISPATTSIEVLDEGPGVPAQESDRLFTKYPNISNRPTNTEESIGLGLYLAQRMAQKIGATISYSPRSPQRGSCFSLNLQPVDVNNGTDEP